MKVFRNDSIRLVLGAAALMLSLLGLTICSSLQSQAGQPERLLAAHRSKAAKALTGNPVIVFETNKGTFKIQVYKDETPITAGNFLDLVHRGFYNGLTFHRFEPNFVIQGGDPTGTGAGGFIDPQTQRRRTIPLEVKPNLNFDSAGVVGMARSNDPNSASCQFYITLGPASWLDGKYAVFGKVIDGMNVVMQLRPADKMTRVYDVSEK